MPTGEGHNRGKRKSLSPLAWLNMQGDGDDVPEERLDENCDGDCEEISSFLMRLRNMGYGYYWARRENVECTPFRFPDEFATHIIRSEDRQRRGYVDWMSSVEAKRSQLYGEPVHGRNINDVENFSYTKLKEITDNFSNTHFIQNTHFGRLFWAKIQKGSEVQDVVIKTWDFYFPLKAYYEGHPARLHDEIVLLMKEETKAREGLPALIGFCCEEKLAVIYNLKYTKTLYDIIGHDDFTFSARMKLALKVADLLKWLHDRFIVVGAFDGSSIMVDEELNITLVDFEANASTPDEFSRIRIKGMSFNHAINPPGTAQGGWGVRSDVFACGFLLMELVTKKRIMEFAAEKILKHPEPMRKGELSIVNDQLSCTESLGCKLTKLAVDCLDFEAYHSADMQYLIFNLKELMGYQGTEMAGRDM